MLVDKPSWKITFQPTFRVIILVIVRQSCNNSVWCHPTSPATQKRLLWTLLCSWWPILAAFLVYGHIRAKKPGKVIPVDRSLSWAWCVSLKGYSCSWYESTYTQWERGNWPTQGSIIIDTIERRKQLLMNIRRWPEIPLSVSEIWQTMWILCFVRATEVRSINL